MFVYNMYLQMHNFSSKDAKRPNVLLLVASTLLFILITTVSSVPEALLPGPSSHVFVTLAVGYRGRSYL